MTTGVTAPTAVTLSDLTRRFGSVMALDGLSWQAPTGRVTAVLGPNGAGKTTAIECAVGLIRPTSGEVTVLGANPLTAGADHRARVGVMLQAGGLAGLDPHGRLDVWDLIEEQRDDGTTVVVTTHSFEEAERLADHLVIMSAGRAVVSGSVADVTREGSLEEVYFGLTRKGRA